MIDTDYSPVETPDDEEERKRREGDYPPARQFDIGANPPPATDQALAVPSAAPIAPRKTIPEVGGGERPQVAEPKRPQWSDYAPPVPHGWAKFGHIMASLNPATNAWFNEIPQERAQQNYRNATAEYEAPEKENAEAAKTEEVKARTGKEQAETTALQNPQPKVGQTGEEQTLHDLMTGDNGKPRINPDTGKPYSYMEAYGAVKQAGAEAKPAQPPHITYDQGVPVTVTDGKKTYDINDPNLPPELKPLVEAANRAHGVHAKEETDRQARSFAQQNEMFNKHQGADYEKDVRKQYDTARDADSRLSRMEAAYQKGLKGDQQAMLSMLTDHIGMTLGLQKGARITKDILNEATQSQPWLAKIASKFDDRGYLSGVTLGPDQMKQMLSLGYEARNRQWDRAFGDSRMYNVPEPPGARDIYKGERKMAEGGANEPPRPEHVPADYVYKENGPKGKGWYKP